MKKVLALSLVMVLSLVPLLTYVQAEATTFKLDAVGDISCNAEGKKTIGNIVKAKPDGVAFLGDLSYDKKGEKCFFDMIKPISKNKTVLIVGNHDSTEDKCKTCTADIIKYLNISKYLLDKTTVYYHLFTQKGNGTIEVFVVDTEKPMGAGSPQYNKLQKDLGASDAWYKVVMMHKDIFGCKCKHDLIKGAKDVRDLVVREGVDLVLLGHNHNYQRSEKLGNTTFVVVGTGGKSHYPLTTPATGQPKTVKSFSDASGYLQLQFKMDSPDVHQINGTFKANSGVIKDQW